MTPTRPPGDALRGVGARYATLLAAGTIERDPAQARLVERLDRLAREIDAQRLARKSSSLGWLFGRKDAPPPRGVYIWGAVGRGKTLLMDLFFDGLAVERKRRAHFHAYMAEVHARIHAFRQKLKTGEATGDDPIRPVAQALAAEARVLCFDELAVVDIADAMILGRLFTALFAEGVIVVATSNVAPGDLYKDGLNRSLFLPFIRLLEERTDAVRLDARTDFRLEKIGDAPVYFTPDDAAASRALDDLFARLTGGAEPVPTTLTVYGRPVRVPRQSLGVARFSFAELCGDALGASDYLAVAQAFHTIVLDAIPRLGAERRNEARRFITLIDIFYERRVKLIASAAGRPSELYAGETGPEAFEFARTVSRLHEMGSREYLARPAGRGQGVTGASTGLVET